MSETCEVVTVDRGGKPVEINKSDFDEKKDALFSDKPKPKPRVRKAK